MLKQDCMNTAQSDPSSLLEISILLWLQKDPC